MYRNWDIYISLLAIHVVAYDEYTMKKKGIWNSEDGY